MQLGNLSTFTLEESRILCGDCTILEDDAGPRWGFDYSNFKTDPSPDILLLGSYRHPNTGNNLVGGINLHYINKNQLTQLSKALPQIMAARNLYSRYHTGKRLLPDIFDNYYRTYNASHISGIKQDALYPKYGFLKSVSNWLKKNVGGLFKTKAQREKDAQPKYPDDLGNMRDRLDQALQQPQQSQQQTIINPDTPEMRAARNAFLQYRQAQQMQAAQQFQQPEQEPDVADLQQYQQLAQPAQPQYQQPQIPQQPAPQQPQQPQQEPTPEIDFDAERAKNQHELQNPNNDLDLDESLVYYSPIAGKYIVEPAYKFVHSNW